MRRKRERTASSAHRALLCASGVYPLAVPGALMILFDVVHSPAGATTLIISLGIITQPLYLLAIEAAVALIVIQAIVVHRLRRIAFPLWSPRIKALRRCEFQAAEECSIAAPQ